MIHVATEFSRRRPQQVDRRRRGRRHRRCHHPGQITKTRQYLDLKKKIVKLTDHTCACNDLTNFDSEANAKTNFKNRQYLDFKKKNREID